MIYIYMRNEDRYIGQERIDRNVQIDMNHWYVKPGQYVSSPNNTSYVQSNNDTKIRMDLYLGEQLLFINRLSTI